MSDFPTRPASDDDWNDLLRQLRNQPETQPRPFFYHRVHARLAARATPNASVLPGWLRRPAYAALCGAVVLALAGDCATPSLATGPLRSETGRPPGAPR